MGCACNKSVNKKYAKDTQIIKDNMFSNNIFGIIIRNIARLFFGIIAISMAMVLMIPALVWFLICIVLGKEPLIKIPNFIKWIHALKGKKK